ncbi:MAG: peptidylprolyl isomerase [Prevotella sp.]|nr:peptidylprolyl isomerase [Prevotella sp.]
MRVKTLVAMLLMGVAMAHAQTDPVIMTIKGQPVSRSEFEYSYNKNNAEGVIDKKTVDEYVDLFVNYKLKVMAALDAHLDTLSSFKKEYLTYRDQLIRPSFVTDSDVVAEARHYYDNMKQQIGPRGLFQASHILILVPQKASKGMQDSAKVRIDSIYQALVKGADFATMAKKVSQDRGSAINGGKLPTMAPGNTVKEFEDVAYSLKDGEMSKPFLTPYGYHIIKMDKRSQVPPFDSLRTNIVRFLEARDVRNMLANKKVEDMVKASKTPVTAEDIYTQRLSEMEAKDPELKNLVREYHDGLLMFEISNRTVWDKAAKDEAGLAAYFKKNKKKYAWDGPRFKGIAYHVKKQSDVAAVRDAVKNIPFDKWADKLRQTFNNDSVIRIRVEKGIFKPGDDALVDKEIFKKDTTVTPLKDYPIDAVYGKKLKAPQDYTDVKGLVTADYQDALEKEWVATLRKEYPVVINRDVLATVNKH